MKGLLNLVNIIAFILIANITVAQCLLKEVPLQNKINQASVIIEGRVVAQSCFWNNAHNRIYTANEIAIFKLFKGNMKGNKIILITHGGIVGNQMERVSDGLELSIGDVGVFFTNSSNINASSPALTGGMNVVAANKIQSFAKYDKRSGTARDPFKTYQNIQNDLHQVIQTQLGNQFVKIKKYKLPEPMKSLKSGAVPVITSFTPDSVTAGNKMMITINGSDFEATQGTGVVSFANPDDGGATFNSIDSPQHYISWSDTKIEMYVANLKEGSNNMRSGSGVIKVTNASGSTGTSGGSVYVKYGRFEIYSSGNLKETDHVDKDGNGGYIFRQNPVFSAVSGRTDAITRAIETWRCKSFINWEIGTDTSVAVDVNDDVSIILWKTTTGSLAYARSYWSGCWNGSSFDWYVDEVDIVTDSTFTWNNGPAAPAGGEYDLESVMLHELGHGHQLGHVNQSTDVMYYSISSGTSRRTLTADDSLGGNYIVGMSVLANACGPSPMTALNLGNCTFCVTPPTLGIVGTDVKCNGGSDGDADLTPTGGTSPFTYVWSNAATTEDISGLVIGTYIVTVTDSAGCTVNDTITITQPSAIITSVIDTSVSCNGGSDGIADLTVSGGTPGYTYLWSTTATTEDVSGLGVGTHTVVVTDANACTKNDSAVITEPAALSSSDTTTNVSCNGGSDGAVDLTPSGGTTGYTYLWSNTATTQDISGLIAGTYTVVITDAYGCTYNDTAVITQPTVLGTSISGTDAICNGGSTGSVDLTVSGGTPAYSYLWSNSSTLEDPAGLTAGTYTITVTDANGCTILDSVVIGQPTAVAVGLSSTDATCNGVLDGTATAAGSGGTPGYTYLWNSSPSQSTAIATGLGAGTYTVTVTDGVGCTVIDSTTVSEPSAIITSVVETAVSCNGGSDGIADLTVSGGTPGYTFLWSTTATTEDISGLTPGTYTVVVTDANGCIKSDSAVITEPSALSSSNTTTDVSCNGGGDGAVDLTPSGGTAGYTYLWSNSATSQDISGLIPGTYTVVITDANGCTYNDTAVITQPTVLGTSISGTDAICNGGSTGSVDLTVSGGTPAYSYLWSNSSTLEDPAGLTAGTYTITVTDANGCTIMDTVIIGQPSAITVTFSKTDASCSGIKDGTATATGAGGTPGYTYLWNSSPPQSTQTATGLGAGTYTVTVTDTNGCTTMDSVTINNIVSLTSGMTVKNALCNGDSNGTATVTVAGGTGTLTYLWNSSPPQSTQTVTGLLAGTYSVTVTDSLGCTITDMATVTEPDVIQIFTSTTPATQGQSDGTATVDSVTGGTSPFTYLWSNSQTTQTATGLGVGSYTVVVTDSNGCVDSATVTITELTDIADISRIPIVTIYPNPVEDQLFLVVMGESGHEIELNLVNILGENVGTEKVKLTGSSPQMVDVSNLPGGIYFIRIHEIGSVAKFIKAN